MQYQKQKHHIVPFCKFLNLPEWNETYAVLFKPPKMWLLVLEIVTLNSSYETVFNPKKNM